MISIKIYWILLCDYNESKTKLIKYPVGLLDRQQGTHPRRTTGPPRHNTLPRFHRRSGLRHYETQFIEGADHGSRNKTLIPRPGVPQESRRPGLRHGRPRV